MLKIFNYLSRCIFYTVTCQIHIHYLITVQIFTLYRANILFQLKTREIKCDIRYILNEMGGIVLQHQ